LTKYPPLRARRDRCRPGGAYISCSRSACSHIWATRKSGTSSSPVRPDRQSRSAWPAASSGTGSACPKGRSLTPPRSAT